MSWLPVGRNLVYYLILKAWIILAIDFIVSQKNYFNYYL